MELSWSSTSLLKSAVRYCRIKFQHVLHGVINQSCMTCCLVAYSFPGGFSDMRSFHPFIKCFCTLLLSAIFVALNLLVHCFPVSCLVPVGFLDHVIKFMEISVYNMVYIYAVICDILECWFCLCTTTCAYQNVSLPISSLHICIWTEYCIVWWLFRNLQLLCLYLIVLI